MHHRFVLILLILAISSVASDAQSMQAQTHAVILEDELIVEIPKSFSKAKRKLLRQYQPPAKIRSAVAYQHADGSKLLLYHTNIPWDFTPITIWDMAFAAMEHYPGRKFLESGYFTDQRNARSTIYFIKIQARMNGREECLLLTFSAFKEKVFQGVYISPGYNYEVWKETSAQLLANHYIRTQNSSY